MRSTFFSLSNCLTPVFSGGVFLALGSHNRQAVSLIQMGLAALGHKLPRSKLNNGMLDGIFGAETDQEVRKFQSSRQLKSDGIVGSLTLRSMDELLALKPLPVAPTTHTIKFPPTKFDMPGTLRKLKQPDANSCWAAVGTMLWEYRNPALVTPQIAVMSARDRIEDVLRRADNAKVAVSGYFFDAFKKNEGLDVAESSKFFGSALGLREPGSSLADRIVGIFGWLTLLSAAQGPIAANSVRIAEKVFNHWFVIVGADSTRSIKNTYAPPPLIEGLDFLYLGVLKYYDPKTDAFGEMSIADADLRLGVLPDLPEIITPSMQYRARVFY
jgi:peptidoglycan hydrolase-like protein with peptidoglycan-binding domain